METDKYRQWHDSHSVGSVWLKGKAGAGKSVVATSLTQALRDENLDAPVLLFFFRHIIQANHTADALARDRLAQLLPYSITL